MAREYVTVQGDMWDSIAKKTLGSEYYMDVLMEANPDYRQIVVFPANVKLVIPDVETEETPDTLPPWRRAESS
mgnify:CR=1 FL=1